LCSTNEEKEVLAYTILLEETGMVGLKKRKKTGRYWFKPALLTLLLGIIVTAAPIWVGYNIIYYAIEDITYVHDLTANISGYDGNMTFAINTLQTNITWTNGSGIFSVSEATVSNWISIPNSSSGELIINATIDSQTGFFEIPIEAKNLSDNSATTEVFEFQVNATNDAPTFTFYSLEYNLTQGQAFSSYLNGTDEESHFPLTFNVSFVNNCTHAAWSGRVMGENCTLFNATTLTNTSALMSYTPTFDDVGTYWAYLSTYDSGSAYSCPHTSCSNETYMVNMTSSAFLVLFNVLATLELNVSNCTGAYLQEDTLFSCTIDVRTQGETDSFNASSIASIVSGWGGTILNRSWYYANHTHTASNFSETIDISFIPTKREVGNWSVNFTVEDAKGLYDFEEILFFVNWTEEVVVLDSLINRTIYENVTFTVNATDDDLLVQDKNTKNEVLTFYSNESWVEILSTQTITGNNYSTATILIDYDSIRVLGNANYTVRINVTDSAGSYDEQYFTVQVQNDSAAEWNQSKSNVSASTEGENVYFNLSEYVSDPEGDTLLFSYTNDTSFGSFNLTSDGIINFSSMDIDVGEHLVTINAYDGKLNSYRTFNFTIYNVYDNVSVGTFPSYIELVEDNSTERSFTAYDDDLWIPDGQERFYNESLLVNVSVVNLTLVETAIPIHFTLALRDGNSSTYLANISALGAHVGSYNVSVNVSDAGNSSTLFSFILNVTSLNDPPILLAISNQSSIVDSVFFLDVNATDEEDSSTLPENGNLTYTLTNLTASGDFLTINATSGVINVSLTSSHAGTWQFNLSVNDTQGATDSQVFFLFVYGAPNITSPYFGHQFNFTEGNQTGNISFEVSYGIEGINLTYIVYMDRIVYSNTTSYNYTSLFSFESQRNSSNHTWRSDSNFTWDYLVGYDDETYGLLKNLTLFVYNPDYPSLNDSLTWQVHINHTNQAINFTGSNISDQGPTTAGSVIEVNLSDYFTDTDYWDQAILQMVNFSIETVNGSGYVAIASSIGTDWILSLESPTATTETIQVIGYEYDSTGTLIGNATSNSFEVEFTTPSTTTTPTPSTGGGGGGSSTKTVIQHYSLKIITPLDVKISDQDYIDLGFSVQNTGQVALSGIFLSSAVSFDGKYTDDLSITLEDTYIENLLIGESRDYTMRIHTNTQRSGRYKATVYGNVTSPRFSDWGEFFIDLNKVNDSEARQLLVFTEKLLAENPECIELTENLDEAREIYSKESYEEFKELANQIVKSCEASIQANEQIRYPFNFARDTFYYISFTTLVLFFAGFIFYIYKRARFNKYRVDEYIGGEYV